MMLKKIFSGMILCSLFSLSFSQIKLNNEEKIKPPKEVSEYATNKNMPELIHVAKLNGYIIGDAYFCKFPVEDIDLIYVAFNSPLSIAKFSTKEKDDIKNAFDSALKEGSTKGPSYSKMTCEQFKIEFDKIIQKLKPKK